MEADMARDLAQKELPRQARQPFNPDQPEAADKERRRDQPLPDAPGTVPRPGGGIEPAGSRPPEDGGVAQHPIHDSDIEDLGPEDFEELTDEVEKTGIKTEP
jgi:hypothetical protein